LTRKHSLYIEERIGFYDERWAVSDELENIKSDIELLEYEWKKEIDKINELYAK
jgi:hypothetical protein